MKKWWFVTLCVCGSFWCGLSGVQGSELRNSRQQPSLLIPHPTLFGLTPFPYDVTKEALNKTHELVAGNGHLYALHFDDGVPWKEALSNTPWSEKMTRDWNHWKQRIPASQKIYVGLAPLALNRRTLAHASGASSLPPGWKSYDLDSPQVMNAYLNYARRIVAHFQPDFLNVGIEAGNMAFNDPVRWPRFETFYSFVRKALKKEWPNLPIGISITLTDLMRPGVGDRLQDVVELSDYLGLSFYPYGSSAYDRQMGQALPPPPYGWRKPLQWVREYTDKPLAIAETGYTTQSFSVKAFGLELEGTPTLQAQYLRELGAIAKKNGYLFVIWFLAVDYDRLYEHIPDPEAP